MHILLTNDDGFASPLLAFLCRTVAAHGHRVTVSAPMTQQSAKGHSFTTTAPVLVRPGIMEGADAAWLVDGTPVDCARLGLTELCGDHVDLVISGINNGWNTGLATYCSGTVGAAREAAFMGYPALALSAEPPIAMDTLQVGVEWALQLGEALKEHPLPPHTLMNVNFPNCDVAHLQPPMLCPISTVCYEYGHARYETPRGETYFFSTPEHPAERHTPGSDADLVRQGYITLTLLGPRPVEEAPWKALLEEL